MARRYSCILYSKEVLLKAAYAFTDSMFIHLDTDGEYYSVTLKSKADVPETDLYDLFENELIAQETRRIVVEKTKDIRQLIVARALSSTMIDKGDQSDDAEDSFKAEDILENWFESYE